MGSLLVLLLQKSGTCYPPTYHPWLFRASAQTSRFHYGILLKTMEPPQQLFQGMGLTPQTPVYLSVSDLANSSTQIPGFVWFGNLVLREVVHQALYDPIYAGWFGFLENISLSNGHCFWTPLWTNLPWQVGQVLGWVGSNEALKTSLIESV